MQKREKRFQEIIIYPEKCSTCLSCQLVCSYTYAKSFNLAKSRILINFVGDIERTIDFSDECIKCGICVSYCNYGALEVGQEAR